MDVFIQISQFLLSLSLLIILHELGHFIPAKLFKTKIEKFYLFFDPYFALVKKKWKGTEFGIGWLPLGGYVKIAGMVDESMDTNYQKQEPQAWEFRSKPTWQKLIIMLGGVTINILLAGVIYAGIYTYWGEAYILNKDLTHGLSFSKSAQKLGFKNGDKILTINKQEINKFSDIPKQLILTAGEVKIDRNGDICSLFVSDKDLKNLILEKQFVEPRIFLNELEGVVEGSPADKANLQKNDKIIAIDKNQMVYWDEFTSAVPLYAGKNIDLTILRGSDTIIKNIVVPTNGKIGVFLNPKTQAYFPIQQMQYSIPEAVVAGFAKMYQTLTDYIASMKLLFKPDTEAYKSLGGFMSIGKQFSPSWDWYSFWQFTAFLSVMLAFLNVLPIPALDGGHVFFLLIELISCRKISEKFLGYAQMLGIVLLLGLFLIANINDILKIFF